MKNKINERIEELEEKSEMLNKRADEVIMKNKVLLRLLNE